jgi:parallel beta-helix repeat protein
LATFPVLLCLSNSAAIAQIPQKQANVLFVNPFFGNDLIGNGSKSAPFKTITQALRLAQPNNTIVLSSGTYSTYSGEKFPLMLKPGVSIQGDPHTRGRSILIKGGGAFLSPTFARQDVTILGANQASLTGVTVINNHPRGYGLWIESSSPVVVDNTFTGNNHDGISITGNSAPTIRSNYFYLNGANGMTIYGTSRPEVRENVFEKTGFGINIAQQAAPLLVGNRITQNRDGVVAQANSRPVLRSNVIEGNREDGVVAIATSQPDLGTPTQPGGNVFRQNSRYDINSRASNQIIPAFGNQLALRRTSGNINLAGTLNPVNQTIANVPNQPPPRNLVPSAVKPKRNPAATAERLIPTPSSNRAPVVIPVPPPLSTSQVLPVPSGKIPSGKRKVPKVKVTQSRATSQSLHYRVVVEAHNQSQQARVRSLVPGAFHTVSNGRAIMQAGAFSDRAQATQVLQKLKSKGLRAKIEQIN